MHSLILFPLHPLYLHACTCTSVLDVYVCMCLCIQFAVAFGLSLLPRSGGLPRKGLKILKDDMYAEVVRKLTVEDTGYPDPRMADLLSKL